MSKKEVITTLTNKTDKRNAVTIECLLTFLKNKTWFLKTASHHIFKRRMYKISAFGLV